MSPIWQWRQEMDRFIPMIQTFVLSVSDGAWVRWSNDRFWRMYGIQRYHGM